MKALVAFVVGLAVAVSANVATAYVAVVATAIPVATAVTEDREQLGDAVRSAIRDVLDHAIGFTPTVVTLQNVTVVGDRLYILLFVADEDGDSTIEALSTNRARESKPDHQGISDSPESSHGMPTPRNTPKETLPDIAPGL
jgi:hypothetical protein